jgi:CheY-like chemotaxis protein
MQRDRGALLEYIIRKQKINVGELCKRLNIKRRTIYGWFDDADLSWKIISEVNKAIDYDISIAFPELNKRLTPSIYLIEDTDLDIEIFKIYIRHFVIADSVTVFKNGENAINNLLKISADEPEKLPDYIFLDLNMPVLDGWDFLSHFHRLNINTFKSIKVYILSSSRSEKDLLRSQNHPLVSEFITKPIELGKMRSIFEEYV